MAKDLKPSELLRSHDGNAMAVEGVWNTGETVRVYNLQIAEYHTYFVGTSEWGFSVWAHNASAACVAANRASGNAFRDTIAAILRSAGYTVQLEVVKRTPLGKRIIDIEVSLAGKVLGGIETKVGRSRYLPLQKLKDRWLRSEGYVVSLIRKCPGS
jgi:hypothetical protein